MTAGTWEVEVFEEAIAIVDSVAIEPRRFDIMIADEIAIADRVTEPLAIAIDEVDPPRGRAGDSVAIRGRGFSAVIANNTVTLASFPATVTAASEVELTVTVPAVAGIADDAHLLWEVTVAGRVAERKWWAKLDPASDLADRRPGASIPQEDEDPDDVDPSRFTATAWNRLATLLEFVLFDQELLTHDGTGLATPGERNAPDSPAAAPFPGQALVVDPAAASSLAWGWSADVTIPYGGTIDPGEATVELLAGGDPTEDAGGGSGTKQGAPADGEVDLAWFHIVRDTGTDTIDRVRILADGSPIYDSGTGLALGDGATYAEEVTGASVSKDEELEIEVSRTGSTSTFKLVGGLRLAAD